MTDTIFYDDKVIINGIKGYVNFIGQDDIWLINEQDEDVLIKIRDIAEFTLIKQALCSVPGWGDVDRFSLVELQKTAS